jgi:hypothetical protein
MGTTLIALVSMKRGETACRKVISSDSDIFRKPDGIENSVDYSAAQLIEDDEWFRLSAFSEKTYCPYFLKQEFSSVNFDSIGRDDFGKIVYLCGVQNGLYYFQRVTPARQINRKVIFFGDQCKYEENSASISLNEYADAICDSTTNMLYFRKLHDISAIFDGIDELYREATDDEVKNFLGYQFIELTQSFATDNVGTNNRKRIAMAVETLKRFSDDEKKKVFDYIKDYCPDLVAENSKFSIHNEDSLKKLLYGIEQRYYTTLVGDERRLANSVITIPPTQGGHPQ